MSENYEDILKKQYGQIQKEKVLPVGTWRLRLKNVTFMKGDAENGKNPCFMFVYVPKAPTDDVDESQLAELGGSYNIEENQIFFKLWYETGRDLNNFFAHVQKHGVAVGEETSIEAAMKAVKGKEVMSYLGTRTFKTKGGEMVTSNDPESFAPVA